VDLLCDVVAAVVAGGEAVDADDRDDDDPPDARLSAELLQVAGCGR